MTSPKIRYIVAFAILLVISSFGRVAAQEPLKEGDRTRALAEMRAYKHEVLAEVLELTDEQKEPFFAVYDEMDAKLVQINNETRELERKVMAAEDASDAEVEAAVMAIFSQKEREGKIEIEYLEKLKETVSPRQLLKLKNAERVFTQKLIRQHRRLRRADNAGM